MSQDAAQLPIPLQGVLASQRSKLQWLRYRTGQPLLQADRLPHQVMFIAEGAVRLIADDPATGPFTLDRLHGAAERRANVAVLLAAGTQI